MRRYDIPNELLFQYLTINKGTISILRPLNCQSCNLKEFNHLILGEAIQVKHFMYVVTFHLVKILILWSCSIDLQSQSIENGIAALVTIKLEIEYREN